MLPEASFAPKALLGYSIRDRQIKFAVLPDRNLVLGVSQTF